jgi:Ca-activated chloride channel family protein
MTRLPLLLAAAGIASLAAAGPAALGRLALMAGLPGLAAPLLSDPAVKGVALYRAGRYAEADAAFAAAGRSATFNRGVSLAATGDYPLARAYFDAVLFAAAGDSEARENRNLVDALIPPVIGQGNESGRIAVKPIATPGGVPTESDPRRLGRPLDAGGRVADEAWLATIQDDPGEFLRLRLEDEHRRRLSLGQTPPEEGDLW